MGKLFVVKGDEVKGTCNHKVSGMTKPPPPPPATSNWEGDFDYVGKMTDQLSDFVKIDGKPVALKSSKSSLNPGETDGKHSGPAGKNFMPKAPTPTPSH